QFPRQDRFGLAHQDEKGGLKSVFCIVWIVEKPPAHAKHHWAMPAYKGFQDCDVALLDEASKKLPIRLACAVAGKHSPAKMLDRGIHFIGRLVAAASAAPFGLLPIIPC